MTEDEIEVFNDSLTRCLNEPRFLERFYELFLASSPEVRTKFEGTDFRKQRRTLKASFLLLMLAADGKPEGTRHLEHLAAVHGKTGRDIAPHLYDVWLECLVRAVRECDSRFTASTERVWRQMLEHGIAFMKARYDDPPVGHAGGAPGSA